MKFFRKNQEIADNNREEIEEAKDQLDDLEHRVERLERLAGIEAQTDIMERRAS